MFVLNSCDKARWDNFNGRDGTLWVWGRAYGDSGALSMEEIHGIIAKALEQDCLKEALERIRGFFALAFETENLEIAAVDHVRSRPLFYGICDGHLVVSDRAQRVRKGSHSEELDQQGLEELRLTLYVTGARTMAKGVSQLNGGEFIVWKKGSSPAKVRSYFQLRHTEPESADETILAERLRCAFRASVHRMLEYAEGRQIMLPLSGGVDSRLIAAGLREAGYDNVQAFCFGQAGHPEVQISQRVAEALGFPWTFVDYTRDEWRDSWGASDRIAYQRYGSQLTSAPVYSDWLAVRKLREDGVAEKGCVFAPGHTGDFITGGHIPGIAFTGDKFTRPALAEQIFAHHYNCSPVEAGSPRDVDWWRDYITSQLQCDEQIDAPGFADEYQRWEWRERQCKYIVNNVRCYEFHDADWWLPLWDREFVSVWQDVPLAMRRNRWWGLRMFEDLIKGVSSGVLRIRFADERKGIFRRIIRRASKRLPRIIRDELTLRERIRCARNQTISAVERYDPEEVMRLTRLGYSINGIVLHHHLEELEAWT